MLPGPKTKSLTDRFWSKVNFDGPKMLTPFVLVENLGRCWEWRGVKGKNGYGYIGAGGGRGKTLLAHRVAWELTNHKEIPEDLQIDHLCRNRLCVNPEHMELVTQAENLMRGTSPPANHLRLEYCRKGHPYAGANLRIVTNRGKKSRVCLWCEHDRDRRRKWRKRHGTDKS